MLSNTLTHCSRNATAWSDAIRCHPSMPPWCQMCWISIKTRTGMFVTVAAWLALHMCFFVFDLLLKADYRGPDGPQSVQWHPPAHVHTNTHTDATHTHTHTSVCMENKERQSGSPLLYARLNFVKKFGINVCTSFLLMVTTVEWHLQKAFSGHIEYIVCMIKPQY